MSAEGELIVFFKGKDESLSRVAGGIGSSFRKLGGVVTAGIAVGGAALVGLGALAVGTGAKLVSLGSDAEEMLGKFNVVFANTGGAVTSHLTTFADAVGRSRFELMGMASTFGDTLKPMGFTEEAAAKMSIQLTQLATDLGSFNNMEMDEALRRLQGTLIGSHENALAFGVIINENTLKAKLAEMGLDNLTGAALEQAKVQARLALLMEGTTDAQGDALRTSASWANQMRALKATITDAATEMGLKLLPVVTPFLNKAGELAREILPKIGDVLANRVIPFLTTLGERLMILFEAVRIGGLSELWAVFEDGSTRLGALLEVFGMGEAAANGLVIKIIEIVTIIGNFLAPIAEWVSSWVSMKDVFIALGLIIGSIIVNALIGLLSALAPVVLAFAALVAVVALIRNAWERDFAGIRDFVAGIWAAILQVFDAFKELFAGNWQGFLDGMRAAWDIAWGALVTFLGNLWAIVLPKLVEFWTAVSGWFAAQDWPALAQTAMTLLANKLSEFWANVEPQLVALWDSLVTWFESTDWQSLAQGVIDNIKESWGTFWEQAQPVVNQWFEDLKTWVTTTDWGEMGNHIVRQNILALATFGLKVLPTLMGWADAIVTWVQTTDWLGIATGIVNGIVAGLAAVGYIVTEFVGGMVQAAFAAAVAALGNPFGGGDQPTAPPGGQTQQGQRGASGNTIQNTWNVNTRGFNAANEQRAAMAMFGGI